MSVELCSMLSAIYNEYTLSSLLINWNERTVCPDQVTTSQDVLDSDKFKSNVFDIIFILLKNMSMQTCSPESVSSGKTLTVGDINQINQICLVGMKLNMDLRCVALTANSNLYSQV